MKLSEFLEKLEFHAPKKSSEYVGKKETNPVMVLEENVSAWVQQTHLEDLETCLKIFEDRVCIQGYPAIYSPQFWIANASLTAINDVLNGYLRTPVGVENERFLTEMLFDLWIKLLNAGPGSTHLHMLNIILKSPDDLLWKYFESLKGEDLKTLIRTLRTDFVYPEDVSPEHYATLMETHIDKVFRSIFTSDQFEEARRDLLDLQVYYLSRMNHVPPHIGPRLSHLCFLICNRYEMENPYLGIDDWVIMRHHLKFIKDVITHATFTKASEAQYRAPIVLEKILHAAVVDKMLDVMFKDFMVMLQTITNNPNSKACMRLYSVYQTGLFEHIDLKWGFEECPYWLFRQCIQALAQLANSPMLEWHIDEFIISTQNYFLLKFTKLSANESGEWHKLLVSYVVSGRRKLVMEAQRLLTNSVLMQNGVLDWRKYLKEARMLIDIISDLPKEFLQNNEESSFIQSAQAYSKFLQELFKLMSNMEGGPGVVAELRPSVHRCIMKSVQKDMEAKASVCQACVTSTIPNFSDLLFVRELLFSIEKALKDEDCPRGCDLFTETIGLLLDSCLHNFRSKGFITVDFNSLLMSIAVRCVTAPDVPEELVLETKDIFSVLFKTFVPAFVQLHSDKGNVQPISSLVYQTLCAIQEAMSQGTGLGRSVDFLLKMGTDSVKLLLDQNKLIMELFIDWWCMDFRDVVKFLFSHSPKKTTHRFQEMFSLLTQIDPGDKHKLLDVLYTICLKYTKLFEESHMHTLLEIYPYESELSQDWIMKITLEVLYHNPQLLVAHADFFVDETVFSTQHFRERCSIMAGLFPINAEVAEKSEDFFMKYITHNDDSISLKAMQTLAPLIKPCMFPPRKARLKVLLKSVKHADVRKMGEALLPDIKNNQRKPAANQQKNVTRDAAKNKAPPKPVLAKTPAKSSYQNVKTNSNVVKPTSKPVQTIPSTESARTEKSDNSGLDQDKKEVFSPFKTSVKPDENDNSEHEKESGDKLKVMTDIETNSITPVTGERDGGDAVKTLDTYVMPVLKRDRTEDSLKLPKNDTNESFSPRHSPLPRIKPSTANRAESEPAVTNTFDKAQDVTPDKVNGSDDDKTDGKVSVVTLTKPFSDTKLTGVSRSKTESDSSESKAISGNSQNLEPIKSVCIYGCMKDMIRLGVFSGILKDAGFDNYIRYRDMESDNEGFDGARVTVLCLSKDVQADAIKQEVQTIENNSPLVLIKLDPVCTHTAQHAGKTCIRMYSKPGEATLRGKWPALKFYELLMHLNYHGILPIDHLLSQEFKEWWMPQKTISPKPVTGTRVVERQTAQRGTAATVFFSYHWGKQRQVEPLYNYLIDKGISCWVGLQQVGGSESLYNKISQGIQESRVVLACITPQYTCTEHCKHEVNIALGLNRPVIPLLVKTDWPIRDKIGNKLEKFEYLKMVLSADGKIDVNADVIESLLNCMKKHVPDLKIREETEKDKGKQGDKGKVTDKSAMNQKSNKQNSENAKKVELQSVDKELHRGNLKFKSVNGKVQSKGVSDAIQEETVDQVPSNLKETQMKRTPKQVHKSASLSKMDFGNSLSKLDEVRGGSHSSMEAERRKSHMDLPGGVVIDEHGYTTRSKSCIIL